MKTAPGQSIIFTNFVDFDSSYGHRRDVPGYAAALEYFDSRLPELFALLQAGDRVEIYRPLIADPKDMRKKRAEKAKEEGRADKVTGGRVHERSDSSH